MKQNKLKWLKITLKSLIFFLIFLVLWNISTNIFILKGNSYGSDIVSFYKLPKDSLDILFLGSSHSYATFSPYVIKEKTNLNSYHFATQQQPIPITYHSLVEALKYQNPKYVVLETYMLTKQEDYFKEGIVRDGLDKMKMSLNKIRAINCSVKDKSQRIYYYFNLLKYHSRYTEIEYDEIKKALKGNYVDNLGFISLPTTNTIYFDNSSTNNETGTLPLSNKNTLYLNKIIDLCNKNNIELIFARSACEETKEDKMYINTVKNIALEKNIPFIDYNENLNTMGFDFKTDFFDERHFSGKGAIKATEIFIDFLNNI